MNQNYYDNNATQVNYGSNPYGSQPYQQNPAPYVTDSYSPVFNSSESAPAAQPEQEQKNMLGMVSLGLAIGGAVMIVINFIVGLIPFVNFLCFIILPLIYIMLIAGVVCGFMGKKKEPAKLAKIGMWVSAALLIIGIIFFVITFIIGFAVGFMNAF